MRPIPIFLISFFLCFCACTPFGESGASQYFHPGIRGPRLRLAEPPVYDFGSIDEGGFVEHRFTLENTGSATAFVILHSSFALSAPFKFKGDVYPGTGGTCASELAAGATCELVLWFNPQTVDSFSSMFTVTDADFTYGAPVVLASLSGQSTGRQSGTLSKFFGGGYGYVATEGPTP